MQYDFLFKIIIIGNPGTGKSAILNRYSDNTFSDNHCSTIGVDFKIKTLDINEKKIKLQIWDTAGQERFKTITTAYYRGAHGIFLVYDVNDVDSFNNLQTWIEEIKKYAAPNPKIFLVANKIDLYRKVTTTQGKNFADNIGADYVEISAKENLNIDNSFNLIAAKILKSHIAQYASSKNILFYESFDQTNNFGQFPQLKQSKQSKQSNQTCCGV